MVSRNTHGGFFMTPEECRLVWPAIFQPKTKAIDGRIYEEPRYQVTLFISKKGASPETDAAHQFYSRKIMEVFEAHHRHANWDQVETDKESWPLKDCDEPEFVEKFPWSAGHWRIKCWTTTRVRLCDTDLNIVAYEPDYAAAAPPLKSGDYGFVSMEFWTYRNENMRPARHGVTTSFEGIKITRRGDLIGSGKKPPVPQVALEDIKIVRGGKLIERRR